MARRAFFRVFVERPRAPRLLFRSIGSVSLLMPNRRSLASPALLGLALVAAVSLRPAAQAPEPRVIEVVARRFAFEPAEIEAVVGERLRLLVRSADGVHGLEIKKLNVKKEIPRGAKPVTIEFTAREEGRFPILCSEYCGDEHDAMTGMLIVRAVPAVAAAPVEPKQETDTR